MEPADVQRRQEILAQAPNSKSPETLTAAREFRPETIVLAGGVSANAELRRQLGDRIARLAQIG